MAQIVSARVTAGRPLVIVRVIDLPVRGSDSGVDPTSLLLGYGRALVAAAAYDPVSGYAIFGLPPEAPRIPVGRLRAQVLAADYQEAKNISTPGGAILPNTTIANISLRAVTGPTVTWLDPERRQCVDRRRQRLLVAADSDRRLRSLTFFDGNRRISRGARHAGAAVRLRLADRARNARQAHAHRRRARRTRTRGASIA